MFVGILAWTLLTKFPQKMSMVIKSGLWLGWSTTHLLLFETLLGGFASMHWPIFVVKDSFPVQLQHLDRCPYILIKHTWIWCRLLSRIANFELSKPASRKATPNHNISTTTLHSCYGALFCSKHIYCYCDQRMQSFMDQSSAHWRPSLLIGTWQTAILL